MHPVRQDGAEARRAWRRPWLAGVLLAALLPVLAGCERTEPTPEERQAVEEAVRGYLDRLARAYSSLDASELEGFATPNEIQAVNAQLRTLASSGDRVHAALLQVDLAQLLVFRLVNASVETLEVWDVRRYDVYTGREKGHNDASVQRALLQLRRVEGRWLVSARMVKPQETPVAVPRPGASEGQVEP